MNNDTFDIDALPSSFETAEAALDRAIQRVVTDENTARADVIAALEAIPVVQVYTVVDAVLDRAKLELDLARQHWNDSVANGTAEADTPAPVEFTQQFVMLGVETEAHAMVQNMRTKLSNMRRVMADRGLPVRRFRICKNIVRRIPDHPLTLFALSYTENMAENATRAVFHVHLILNKDDLHFARPKKKP